MQGQCYASREPIKGFTAIRRTLSKWTYSLAEMFGCWWALLQSCKYTSPNLAKLSESRSIVRARAGPGHSAVWYRLTLICVVTDTLGSHFDFRDRVAM
jgi:hypothetical protein